MWALAALAQPEPAACDVTAAGGPLAAVVHIDCDLIGERYAYSPEAHRQVHADVAALDAMLDEAKAQRELLRQELTADREVCAAQVRALALDLRHCAATVERVGDPPSRVVWAAIGAGLASVVAALVYVAAD